MFSPLAADLLQAFLAQDRLLDSGGNEPMCKNRATFILQGNLWHGDRAGAQWGRQLSPKNWKCLNRDPNFRINDLKRLKTSVEIPC